jgi:L-asparaginase/Glu-tRNA(Gln) amidotransferase subunit D
MPKVQRKRIGLLFAGGTALSQKPKPWELVRSAAAMRRWLDNFPELHIVADVEPVFVTGKTATQIGAAEWLQLAQAVKQHALRVDGFVILHGIETLHFTANALSLMLRSLLMTVVLSGSPLRIGVPRSGQVEFGATFQQIL